MYSILRQIFFIIVKDIHININIVSISQFLLTHCCFHGITLLTTFLSSLAVHRDGRNGKIGEKGDAVGVCAHQNVARRIGEREVAVATGRVEEGTVGEVVVLQNSRHLKVRTCRRGVAHKDCGEASDGEGQSIRASDGQLRAGWRSGARGDGLAMQALREDVVVLSADGGGRYSAGKLLVLRVSEYISL